MTVPQDLPPDLLRLIEKREQRDRRSGEARRAADRDPEQAGPPPEGGERRSGQDRRRTIRRAADRDK